MNEMPPPGWYPSQAQPGQTRYWDGQRWAEPSTPGQPMPIAPVAGQTSADAAQWWKRTWVIAVGAGILGLVIGTSGGSGDDDTKNAAANSQPTETVTEVVTETVTETVPEAAEEESPKPRKTQAAAAPSKPKASSADGPYVMPNEVGKSLQGAQDDLQEVSGNPFFFSFSEDASGQGRMQILDSGWQVCSQEPSAGEPFGEYTDVTFFVVRESETCP